MKVPLVVAFQALARMMLRGASISALQLVTERRVSRYETAWSLCMRLRGGIAKRLFDNVGFSFDGRNAESAAAAHVCGRLRPRARQAHVRFHVDEGLCLSDIALGPEPLDHGGGADDSAARGMLENFRKVFVTTHHGVTAKYLCFYALEHIARYLSVPFEIMIYA